MLKHLKKNKSVGIAGIVLLALVSCGCKKKEEPPPPSAPPPRAANPQQKVQKSLSSVQKRVSSVQKRLSSGQGKPAFDFSGKKDPFKPYIPPVQVAPQKTEVRKQRVRTDLLPIQSYDVTKFKVSGIITGLTENQALVIDPAGKGYVVRQGMKIGNNDGVIVRITPTTVEVLEKYEDDSGRTTRRTVKLTLPQKK